MAPSAGPHPTTAAEQQNQIPPLQSTRDMSTLPTHYDPFDPYVLNNYLPRDIASFDSTVTGSGASYPALPDTPSLWTSFTTDNASSEAGALQHIGSVTQQPQAHVAKKYEAWPTDQKEIAIILRLGTLVPPSSTRMAELFALHVPEALTRQPDKKKLANTISSMTRTSQGKNGKYKCAGSWPLFILMSDMEMLGQEMTAKVQRVLSSVQINDLSKIGKFYMSLNPAFQAAASRNATSRIAASKVAASRVAASRVDASRNAVLRNAVLRNAASKVAASRVTGPHAAFTPAPATMHLPSATNTALPLNTHAAPKAQENLLSGGCWDRNPALHQWSDVHQQTYLILWKGTTAAAGRRVEIFLTFFPDAPYGEQMKKLAYHLECWTRKEALRAWPCIEVMEKKQPLGTGMTAMVQRILSQVPAGELSDVGAFYLRKRDSAGGASTAA